MCWPTQGCSGWKEFNAFADSLIDYPPAGYDFLFRGQPCCDWPLTHSLSRKLLPPLDEEDHIAIENKALQGFQERAHLLLDPCVLPKRDDLPRWWSIMQHHSAPTRLLDWTKSPFIALYFAVVDRPERDGGIWWFNAGALMERMEDLHECPDIIERPDFSRHFQTIGDPHYLFPLDCYQKNQRMIIQQGTFTICRNVMGDHGKIIHGALKELDHAHGLLVIPKEQKPEMLRNLELVNMTATSLFPGIDGLGRSIGELVIMESWHHAGVLDEK